MIVDCHTHWGHVFQARDGRDPAPWLTVPDRHGIDHAVVLPEAGLWHAGRIAKDNDDVAAVCAKSGGRMIPFCTVNTFDRAEALCELDRALNRLHMSGIKFHPWVQGFSVATETMDEICEVAAEHCVPILFHDGTPPCSLPSQIAVLARRHPRTVMILGHCGLLEHWREAIAAMRHAGNLWGCICGPHPAAIKEMLSQCDTDRLVWGTDYGFGFADSMDYRLRMLDRTGVGDDMRQALLATNPARLLGLNAPAAG